MAGDDRALRVWVLSDGQPGHYNQARGIVAALRRLQPLQEHWIPLKLCFGLARNLLRFHLNHFRQPGSPRLLRAFYRMGALPEGGCDLLVSAGGKTSFANAWLAKTLGVPNIYSGSLRRLSPQLFSVVLTLEPVADAPNNLVLPLHASAIDYDEVQRQGAAFRERVGDPEKPCWLLLAGGNGAGYRYVRQDWIRLANLMNRFAGAHGIDWLVVTSRRTGRSAERQLRSHLDPARLVAACWSRDGGDYQPEAWLGAAERVFVTEDSMTMLTEAIYSRRPVYSLQPRHALPDSRYRDAMRRFADRGFICRHPIADLLLHPDQLDRCHCRVLDTSPLAPLSEALRHHLPGRTTLSN